MFDKCFIVQEITISQALSPSANYRISMLFTNLIYRRGFYDDKDHDCLAFVRIFSMDEFALLILCDLEII